MEWEKAHWLKLSEQQIREQQIYSNEDSNHFVYYRCQIDLPQQASLHMLITACSRYRLWINERPVIAGPCKSDGYHFYYDEVEVSEYLHIGRNTFAVQVLYCNPYATDDQADKRTSLIGVVSNPMGHRLCVEGDIFCEGKKIGSITSGAADWKCFFDHQNYLLEDAINENLGAVSEHYKIDLLQENWKKQDFDDSGWFVPETAAPAKVSDFNRRVGFLPKLNLTARPIPLLEQLPGRMEQELGKPVFVDQDGMAVDAFSLQAHDKVDILFLLPEYMSGYMSYGFSGGRGAKVTISYLERLMDGEKELSWKKWKRNDLLGQGYAESNYEQDREAAGMQQDTLLLCGGDFVYEPFWLRVGRYVQIHVETAEEALTICRPTWLRVGYPLHVDHPPVNPSPEEQKLFEICLNTLRNCMWDTYMDCPYYEEMQFVMDTRLQVLFQLKISDDTRLARKALEDFHCSMLPIGLIGGKAPCAHPQIISTFSLHYIFMIWEYFERTGDLSVLHAYRNDVDRILEYFGGCLAENGMIGNPGFWPFVDWQDDWKWGIPCNALQVPSAVISLIYGYALLDGAKIWEASGRRAVAEEYRSRQRQITEAVKKNCWNADRGLYQDGPGLSMYSQHVQSWAVLNGMCADWEEAKSLMLHALKDKDVTQCSFATSLELFLAVKAAGLEEEIQHLLKRWYDLLETDTSTCPEVPVGGRSACHAWSALPILGTELLSPGRGK